jgi:hypothetical protein
MKRFTKTKFFRLLKDEKGGQLSVWAKAYDAFASQSRANLKWTGSIVDWVELIYALHETESFNNGKISLKELFQQMGEMFDFEVKEFANYFMNIKNRKDGQRTKFTDLLRDAVLGRMTGSDRKSSRK